MNRKNRPNMENQNAKKSDKSAQSHKGLKKRYFRFRKISIIDLFNYLDSIGWGESYWWYKRREWFKNGLFEIKIHLTITFPKFPKLTKFLFPIIKRPYEILSVTLILIRRKLKPANEAAGIPYKWIISILFFLFCGSFQMLLSYKGSSFSAFFNNYINSLNVHTDVSKDNWETFAIRDVPNLVRRNPTSDRYKVELDKYSVSIVLSPFFRNEKNQLHFSFISLDLQDPVNLNLKPKSVFCNYFHKYRAPISIVPSNPCLFDSIPVKIQGVPTYMQKKKLFDLIELEEKKLAHKKSYFFNAVQWFDPLLFHDNKKEPIILNKKSHSYKKHINRNQKESFLIISREKPIPTIELSPKKEKDLNKQVFRNKKMRKLLDKVHRKNTVMDVSRKVFYEEGYGVLNTKYEYKVFDRKAKKRKTISPQNLNSKTRRKIDPYFFPISNRILRYELYPLDILKIMQKVGFCYSNLNLQPRLCSNYQYPNSYMKRLRSEDFLATKPLKLNMVADGKYRAFFIDSLLKPFKKRNRRTFTYPTCPNTDFNASFDHVIMWYKPRPFPVKKTKFKKFPEWMYRLRSKILPNTYYRPYELVQPYSWLIITKLGFALLYFKYYRATYQRFGREFVLSLANLIAASGFVGDPEWWKLQLGIEYPRTYRAIKKTKTRFKDAVDNEYTLAPFKQTFLYLQLRQNLFSNFLNLFYQNRRQNRAAHLFQSILLVGPPGTGKTLFVRSIAGETGVPVLSQSGGVLKNYRRRGGGGRAIIKIFNRARYIAPCIVFIDELDGIGRSREDTRYMNWLTMDIDLIKIAYEPEPGLLANLDDLENFLPKSVFVDVLKEEFRLEEEEIVYFGETVIEAKERIQRQTELINKLQLEYFKRIEQIVMLTQLLIELDGVKPLKQIMVFGATNRPYILDPALLRPGRFFKRIGFSLPNEKKRLKLLNFYMSTMGVESGFDPLYIAQQMIHLSSAEVDAVVKESGLLAACEGKKHNFKSLEVGIERVISYLPLRNLSIFKKRIIIINFELRLRWLSNSLFRYNYQIKNKKNQKRLLILKAPSQRFISLNRIKNFDLKLYNAYYTTKVISVHLQHLAYYRTGKAIVEIFLPEHPSSVYFDIQERDLNFRRQVLKTPIVYLMEGLEFRSSLESRIIGFLAGRASEALANYASISSHVRNIPFAGAEFFSLGEEDIYFANLLSFLMVEKWFYYSEDVMIESDHTIEPNYNKIIFDPYKLPFLEEIYMEYIKFLDRKNRLVTRYKRGARPQKWSYKVWHLKEVMEMNEWFDRCSWMEWYRFLLPEKEENELNKEWVPSDLWYYQHNIRKGRIARCSVLWYQVIRIAAEHLYHSLLIEGINVGFSILNTNRELLDYFVDFALRNGRVRNPQIQALLDPFLPSIKRFEAKDHLAEMYSNMEKLNKEEFLIFENWGDLSRRRISRFMDLKEINENEYKDPTSKAFLKVRGILHKSFLRYPIPEEIEEEISEEIEKEKPEELDD